MIEGLVLSRHKTVFSDNGIPLVPAPQIINMIRFLCSEMLSCDALRLDFSGYRLEVNFVSDIVSSAPSQL